MPLTHANGVEFHYHLQGKGTAVVFLHPACIGSRVFTYLRNDLSQDHRTLLFDFRGHGRSGGSSGKITMPLLVEDTCRLMDALDMSSAYLCAYSASSLVALEAMLTHPDRFRGAILLSGMAEAAGWRTKTKLRFGSIAARMRARELLAYPQLWKNSDSIETYRRLRKEMAGGHLNHWRDYMDSIRGYSAVARLPEIEQPVLIVCGERDEEAKRHARVLQQGLPNDSTVFLPGRSHALPTYGSEEVGPLIRGWLYAQEGRRPEMRDDSSLNDNDHLIAQMELRANEYTEMFQR
ncbi:alpha/beta fold hydrolase [Cohnella candidum]|uniref:Alpha/beta hydrolase n=1 Tax=Cohnella candidum TaxID=2674991 RepID=A0A3G3JT28_9BACL|nr:alpha/beta hydrolase [Cohnella candidum]AYQ71380.1 alpha/beta hydrolase [Cohnella candidum]